MKLARTVTFSLLALATLATLAGLSGPAVAGVFAGVAVPPPLPTQTVTDTHWGVSVPDPYRFLEDVKDPAVQNWMKGQAQATDTILGAIPGRTGLLQRIQDIEAAAAGVATSVRRTEGDRLFFLRRNPDEGQLKLVWRDGTRGPDQVLVDPEALSKAAGRPHAIMDFAPSPDGRQLAYSVQVGGGEIGTLHVIDVATGRPLIEPIDRIRYAGAAWLDDGSGFFYSRLAEGYDKRPPTERFRDGARHFHDLRRGEDRLVFSASRQPALQLPTFASGYIAQIPGTQTAMAIVSLGVERNRLVLLADLAAAARGDARWRKVIDVGDQISAIAYAQGWLYLRSAKDAPRFKVLRMPLADPQIEQAQTVLPASTAVVVGLAGARDGVYVTRREGAVLSLAKLNPGSAGQLQGALHPIVLPVQGTVSMQSTDPRLDGVVLQLGGWTRAATPWLYDGRRLHPLTLARAGAFDAPADIEAREVRVKSHDGVEVPMSIILRKGTVLDGRNPTILYGYGAYGTTENPGFSRHVMAWIERGGIYAFAHVRGGGVYGDAWHQAGRKTTKPNTWRDAIAAAEWLVAQRYTSPARLGVYGGSAGGILVGRALTERPDLFAAAVSSVGVLDTVRSERRANGVANIPEYGTVTKEDEFHGLLAMSSYHHVRDGIAYPGVMLVHGVNDIRVDVWQSAKFASRLAAAGTGTGSAAGTGSKPVLLRLDYEAGHGQGSTRAQTQARSADVYSFFLWQFGEAGFQPAAPASKP